MCLYSSFFKLLEILFHDWCLLTNFSFFFIFRFGHYLSSFCKPWSGSLVMPFLTRHAFPQLFGLQVCWKQSGRNTDCIVKTKFKITAQCWCLINLTNLFPLKWYWHAVKKSLQSGFYCFIVLLFFFFIFSFFHFSIFPFFHFLCAWSVSLSWQSYRQLVIVLEIF